MQEHVALLQKYSYGSSEPAARIVRPSSAHRCISPAARQVNDVLKAALHV